MTTLTTQRLPSHAPLRAQRGTTALVAQYIHELSARHEAQRRAARPQRRPVAREATPAR